MKRKITMKKKNLSLFLSAAALTACILAGNSMNAQAAGNVTINATNFPDENFRSFVRQYDQSENGILEAAELAAVETMDVEEKGFEDLTGIEHFVNLKELNCSSNNLSTLDVSGLNNLAVLYCISSNLSSLNVSDLNNLTVLYCSDNNLSTLDVSGLNNLTDLICCVNNLTSLNVNGLNNLTDFDCHENNLTSLDVSSLKNLTDFNCTYNNLSSLNISGLKNLTNLYCNNNSLSNLDVSSLDHLKEFFCFENNLSSLDVSNLDYLTNLSCSENRLTSLNVSNLNSLTSLGCSENNLTNLDVSDLNNLTFFSCSNNSLSSLDVSDLNNLRFFYCSNNNLGSLNLCNLTNLEGLSCDSNNLTDLDVSNLRNLGIFECNSNNISYLDVSNLKKIYYLNCSNNNLTSLNVSGLNDLVYLNCQNNHLTNLDADTLNELAEFNCDNNVRTVLVSSKNQFDLSTLKGFDVKKCSNWSGGTVSGTILTFQSDTVTYTYNTGAVDEWSSKPLLVNFTLMKKSSQLATPAAAKLSNTASGIKVSWSAVSGAEKYRIYRKTDSTCWNKIADTTSASYVDTTAKSGTAYTYTIRCINAAGTAFTSDYNKTGSTLVRLAQPTVKAANTSTGVKLSWSAISGADSYILYYKTTGGWTRVAADPVKGTSYTWKGAKSGTSYMFTMKAVKGSTQSSYNTTGTSLTYVAQPTIKAANASTGVKLSWSAVSGADSYILYYKTTGGWTRVAADPVKGTSYTWKGAKSGTSYKFTMKAVKGSTQSSYNTTGTSLTYVAQPTIKAANASTGVKLSWSAVSGADSYILYYKTTGGWTRVVADPVTGTSYTWKGAKSGTSYKFTMKAVKGSTQSSYNTTGTALVRLTQPTLGTLSRSGKNLTLTWSKVTGASAYRVYRKTGTGSWVRIATVTGTSYTDVYNDTSALSKGTTYTYTYTVRAEKGSSLSSYNATGKKITY